MRVIYVNARFLAQKKTGVQRYAIEISKQLCQMDPSIVFLAPHDVIDLETAKVLNARIIGKNTGTAWEQLDLPRFIKKANTSPLLLNLCNTAPLLYSNFVVAVHDMSYKINPTWFSKKFYYWYNFLIPMLVKKSKLVITVSQSSKNDIIRLLGTAADKIEVVYNASNLPTSQRGKRDSVKKGKYILTVSSLDPRKNLLNLMRAINITRKKIRLSVVGTTNKNFSQSDTLDHNINPMVDFLGYIDDNELQALYQNAAIFAYPSFYEGFGLPPLEAMSLGCPVIVSDIPSLREVCGNAALYVQPDNIKDIAEKIDQLLENDELRKKMAVYGMENAQRFSWEISAKKILNILYELS